MRVYLDHAATSPLRPEVRDAMLPFLTDCSLMGNPSSTHYEGRRAAEILEQCHDAVANYFRCRTNEVVFNSGGSEGDTHVLLGVAMLYERQIHVAISAIEHKAVIHAAERLASLGHRVTKIPVTGSGVLELGALERLFVEDSPDLVSVMAINNEVGTVQPVDALASLCQAHGAFFHVDAVQAVGHGFDTLVQNPNIGFLTMSAHKIGGPRGIGVLVQRGAKLPALICGGSQEHGCRAGTENVAGAVGLVTALRSLSTEEAARVGGLQRSLEASLKSQYPDAQIHGFAAARSNHITGIAFPGTIGRHLQQDLDRAGLAVGLGSACTGCSRKVSHVLEAMSVPSVLAEGTLRISIGWSTTAEEIGSIVDRIVATVGSHKPIHC